MRVANGLSRQRSPWLRQECQRRVSGSGRHRSSTSRLTTYIVAALIGGDPANRFVFKPCDRVSAQLEQRRLREIGNAIDANELAPRLVYHRSSALWTVRTWLFSSWSAGMPTLAEARRLPPKELVGRLRDAAEFLALIHGCLLAVEGGNGTPKGLGRPFALSSSTLRSHFRPVRLMMCYWSYVDSAERRLFCQSAMHIH